MRQKQVSTRADLAVPSDGFFRSQEVLLLFVLFFFKSRLCKQRGESQTTETCVKTD